MFQLRPTRSALLALAIAATTPAAAYAAPAPGPAPSVPAAAASCDTGATTSKAFAKFKDLADYSLAPGGDFEHGTAGWRLLNTAVVNGNDTTGVGGGTHSLLLGASRLGGLVSATSPEFCVTEDHPTFRFAIKTNTLALASGLLTTIDYRVGTSTWINVETSTIGLQPSRSWVPSAVSPLATKIPAAAFKAGVVSVRLSFLTLMTTATAGGIQIDNVMVDPYRRS